MSMSWPARQCSVKPRFFQVQGRQTAICQVHFSGSQAPIVHRYLKEILPLHNRNLGRGLAPSSACA